MPKNPRPHNHDFFQPCTVECPRKQQQIEEYNELWHQSQSKLKSELFDRTRERDQAREAADNLAKDRTALENNLNESVSAAMARMSITEHNHLMTKAAEHRDQRVMRLEMERDKALHLANTRLKELDRARARIRGLVKLLRDLGYKMDGLHSLDHDAVVPAADANEIRPNLSKLTKDMLKGMVLDLEQRLKVRSQQLAKAHTLLTQRSLAISRAIVELESSSKVD